MEDDISGPVRASWTEAELAEAARVYMVAHCGRPKDLDIEGRDRWYEDMGMLTHFLRCLWMNKFE